MRDDLPFWKQRLESEKERLKDLLEFSKGVEHSATMDARRGIKRIETRIEELEAVEAQGKLAARYRAALQEVLCNLRSIDGPNEADEYIDDSIEIIEKALKED